MKFYITLFVIGFCHLALSSGLNIEAISEEMAEDLIKEIVEQYGDNAKDYVLEAAEKLDELAKMTEETENELLEVEDTLHPYADGTMPWDREPMDFPGSIIFRKKWKKFLHKAKHMAGEIMKGAATSMAGKAVAGVIAG